MALAEEGQPWLKVNALDTAQRAFDIDPSNSQAVFNLALALEELSLIHQARLAWKRYIQLGEESGWRGEGEAHLARLQGTTERERWDLAKPALRRAASSGDLVTLQNLTREFSGPMKKTLETELLPAALAALGTPMERYRVSTASYVAEAVAETGERFFLEAVRRLERSHLSPRSLVGYRQLQGGLARLPYCSVAQPLLREAQRNLTASGSPLAFRARYEEIKCLFRKSVLEAEPQLERLALDLAKHPFPSLQAQSEELLGFYAVRAGRLSEGILHYERATRIRENAEGPELFDSKNVLAELAQKFGEREMSWKYRSSALTWATRAGNLHSLQWALSMLAFDLVWQGRHAGAIAVIGEMLANARTWQKGTVYEESLLCQNDLKREIGSREQARQRIEKCLQLLAYPQPGRYNELAEPYKALEAAAEMLRSDPRGSWRGTQASALRAQARNDAILFQRALGFQAQAEIALQRPKQAQSTFERILRIYEKQRENTSREEWQISFFASAQPAFDDLITLQSETLGDIRAAFLTTERVRARNLRDRLRADVSIPKPGQLEDQLNRIPIGVALLAYAVLQDRVLVWRLGRGTLTKTSLPLKREDLAKLVQRTVTALRSGAPSSKIQAVAGKAFDALLRGLLPGLPPETELVFLPDRELYQLPFAALFDSRRSRYLVEDHPSSIASSLAAYLKSVAEEDSWSHPPERVLAIGDPAFDPKLFPSLRRLPGAETEARSVGALYPNSTLLLGDDATRGRILAALPHAEIVDLAAHVFVDPLNPLRSMVATAAGEPALETLNAEKLPSPRLAFLAGCQTAPGFSDGDREGVSGLARAFLQAGVPLVVGTRWEVADTATTPISLSFHSRLRTGVNPAQALRLAQIAALRQAKPSTWAAFQLLR